jgi:uncharacterized protein (TIGR03437 family)
MKHHAAHVLAVLLLTLGGNAKATSTLYVGTNLGPYKSADGGATWKQVLVTSPDPVLQGVPTIRALVVDPQNPSNVYASALYASAPAFLKSTDAGQTWSSISQPTVSFASGPGSLAIDPVHTNVIYSKTLGSGQTTAKIIRSMDGGLTWTMLTLAKPTSPAGNSVGGVTVSGVSTDPNNSGVVYAAGPDFIFSAGKGYLLKSTDFGTTWSVLADLQDFGGDIYVDPNNSQTMYASNTGQMNTTTCPSTANGGKCGLFKSIDGGKSWTELSSPTGLVGTLGFDTSPGTLYAGASYRDSTTTQVNVIFKSADAGATWTQVKDGFFLTAPLVRTDRSAASTVYAVPSTSGSAIYKSTDGGSNWTSVAFPHGCNSPNETICSFLPRTQDFVVAPAASATPPAPAISANGVVNAASLQRGITANSWVTIFGTNLASKTDNWSNSIVNGQLPTSLDGVSVTIGAKPAYIYFISPGQINVLAPDIGTGPVSVTVTTSSGTSATFTATASQYTPSFFEWPNNQPVATRQDYSYAAKAGTFAGATTVPAKPGDVIILWGTGFGPTNPAAPVGVAVPGDKVYATSSTPAVTINNNPVKLYGAALASGAAGLYQIAIQVPAALADGDWPIQATIGGVQSPTGVLLTVHH